MSPCALAGLAPPRHILFAETMVFASTRWRARRSVLFVPASNRRALEKAASLACDGVIFDLEDSVGAGEAAQARTNLALLATAQRNPAQEWIVRLPAHGAPGFREALDLARTLNPDAVLLPKLETPAALADVCALVPGLPLWAMIETPAALMNLREIVAGARQSGLSCLVVGPNDLSRSTGVPLRPGRAAFVPWLMAVIAAARSARLAVLDGVFNGFGNTAGFADECAQAAELGFDGKTLIHPSQIKAANAAFVPSQAELDRARRVVAAFGLPANQFSGVVGLDGEMVERLHLEQARQLLEYAAMCGL